MIRKLSGIYMFKNLVTNKFYIGSSVDIDKRYYSHIHLLRNNKHYNYRIQDDYNQHTLKSFVFCVIEYAPVEKLLEYETIYIQSLNPSYNISKDASAPMLGRKHSDKTKQKLSGKLAWNRGISRTEEEKTLMSMRRKEVWDATSEEKRVAIAKWHKENPSKPFLGKHHTISSKSLLRKAHLKLNRKIICLNDGNIFLCQNDAAKYYNIKQGHISEQLHRKRASAKGYTFDFIDP